MTTAAVGSGWETKLGTAAAELQLTKLLINRQRILTGEAPRRDVRSVAALSLLLPICFALNLLLPVLLEPR